MSNLLPPDARKGVAKEYWLRVVSVWLMLFAFACLIVGVLAFPSFVAITTTTEDMASTGGEEAAETAELRQAESAIMVSNLQASQILSQQTDVSFSALIQTLEDLSGNGVSLTSYDLSQTEGILDPIIVRGVADSRTTLTGFVERIEAEAQFAEAELPIANLAKDTDIAFQITITPVETI